MLVQNDMVKVEKGPLCLMGVVHSRRVSELCKGQSRSVGRRQAWINLEWQLVGGDPSQERLK